MLWKLTTFLMTALVVVLCPLSLKATQFYGDEATAEVGTYEQPNEGTPVTFQAKFWGNSIIWEHETTSGYTIVRNDETNYWCYAVLSSTGDYTYSDSAVGINSPPPGISPHLRRSAVCLTQKDSLMAAIDAGMAEA